MFNIVMYLVSISIILSYFTINFFNFFAHSRIYENFNERYNDLLRLSGRNVNQCEENKK